MSYAFVIVNKSNEFYSHTTKDGKVVFADWNNSKLYETKESAKKAVKRLEPLTSEEMIVCEV